jgi:hypothetical protein
MASSRSVAAARFPTMRARAFGRGITTAGVEALAEFGKGRCEPPQPAQKPASSMS